MTVEEETKYQFDVEVNKILDLMINSLYTNKEVTLRELISNAADACDKARYLAITKPELLEGDPEFKINILIDKDAKILTVADNGIGMNKNDLVSNLGTIAKSGTEGFLKRIQREQKDKADNATVANDLIGQFGVGFYASFMIAREVEVYSRKLGEKKVHCWKSDGSGTFTVTEVKDLDLKRGTIIKLHLKEGEEEFLDFFRIQYIVKAYSNHLPLPIYFIKDQTSEPKQLNEGVALWTKPKAEITQEEYEKFFKNISYMQGKPFMILHNTVEGVANFTNLLFIPDSRPFDLFHPDRMTRVKLYVKKVFITEENIELIPRFLRFVQGIVDSQDLPLNISRETLQYNSVIDKIKHSLIKKILGELAKKANKEPEEYLKFWQNFGCVLKEGLCEQSTYKDDLLGISRFYSSLSPDKLISLEEYLGRMKERQDSIYYFTGEKIEDMMNSPQLEGFRAKGVEVLLLNDTVDDFWVTVVDKYQDKNLKSITRSDIDLEQGDKPASKAASTEELQDVEEKAEQAKLAAEAAAELEKSNPHLEGFIQLAKEVLGNKVKDIQISKRLTNSPVCLAVDEKAMDIRLERYLVEQKQLAGISAKILEINPQHQIILSLNDDVKQGRNLEEVKKYIRTLFDEACVVEGEKIDNAKDFMERLNELLNYKISSSN